MTSKSVCNCDFRESKRQMRPVPPILVSRKDTLCSDRRDGNWPLIGSRSAVLIRLPTHHPLKDYWKTAAKGQSTHETRVSRGFVPIIRVCRPPSQQRLHDWSNLIHLRRFTANSDGQIMRFASPFTFRFSAIGLRQKSFVIRLLSMQILAKISRECRDSCMYSNFAS
jgi:hypothetical protein